MRDKVFNEVAGKITEILDDKDLKLQDDTLLESLGMNSISFIKLLVFIEDTYDVEFDDEDLVMKNYVVFADVIDKICSMISE